MSDTIPGTIVVAGDCTVDWMLAAPAGLQGAVEASYQWEVEGSPGMSASAGGAAMLTQLLADVSRASGQGDGGVIGPVMLDSSLSNPSANDQTRTFSIWRLFPVMMNQRDPLVWRMDRFLGRRSAPSASHQPPATPDLSGRPQVTAVEDANLGFREQEADWRPLLAFPPVQRLIVKMTSPLGHGSFWQAAVAKFGDITTLYCSVSDLRKEGAAIGRSLSWEQMCSDIVTALQTRPDLTAANRVVVSVGLSGAVIVERDLEPILVYDPYNQEGDWEAKRPGLSFGAGTCIVAGLVAAAAEDASIDGAVEGVRRGLATSRLLHQHGYDEVGTGLGARLAAPIAPMAECLAQGNGIAAFSTGPIGSDVDWQLFKFAFDGSFRKAAERIAIAGEDDAGGAFPIERMGAWMSADRTEIESMRSVRNIIAEYLAQPRRGKPLNLAVFGPPGAGKSFGIKQMAAEIGGQGSAIKTIEFNLSQFADFAELPNALQRVRDSALEETLPLVFWDEFDTSVDGRELAWLAKFLAPMQDGAFLDQGVLRPIGPAIFVFAGGTRATMEEFRERAMQVPSAKATDFLSRLRGFVNVLGPNPSHNANQPDESYPIRRAMLLRSILKRRAPQVFEGNELRIDPGVLRAFLDVPVYLHGARSMESIVEISALARNLRFVRAALPASHQLGLHVDPVEFLRLVEMTPANEAGRTAD